MPIHDWTRAPGGYFHHFHQRWTGAICDALNEGRLPDGVFALVEQSAIGVTPDILALESSRRRDRSDHGGGVALAVEAPTTRIISFATEEAVYAAKANRVVLHRDDAVIAVIEIVSPGNKSSAASFRQFVDKSAALLRRGIHLLVVDLFPPTPRDPQGVHAAVWGPFGDDTFALPADKPLTLASYVAAEMPTAYVEPVAVGDPMPEMPVFLDHATYVKVPLESTYALTWAGCPREFRERVTNIT